MVPAAAGTLLVPTMRLTPCVVERLLMFQKTGDWEAQTGRLYAGASCTARGERGARRRTRTLPTLHSLACGLAHTRTRTHAHTNGCTHARLEKGTRTRPRNQPRQPRHPQRGRRFRQALLRADHTAREHNEGAI